MTYTEFAAARDKRGALGAGILGRVSARPPRPWAGTRQAAAGGAQAAPPFRQRFFSSSSLWAASLPVLSLRTRYCGSLSLGLAV